MNNKSNRRTFDADVYLQGLKSAVHHIEAGSIKFTDFVDVMILDIGEPIRPYLKSIYVALKYAPEMKYYTNDMDSSEYLQSFNSYGERLAATKEQIDRKLREVLSTDMIDREYQSMIELNRQLEIVVEDGDWGDEVKADIERRINLLQSFWCSFIMAERKFAREEDKENIFRLCLRMNMLEIKMWNLIDYGADENTPISDTDKQWIIKSSKEEMKRITFGK